MSDRQNRFPFLKLLLFAALIVTTTMFWTVSGVASANETQSRCENWAKFKLDPDTKNDEDTLRLLNYFIAEYRRDDPDDGCLVGASLAITDRIFAHPDSPFYENSLKKIETLYKRAQWAGDTRARDAITDLAGILQARWVYLNIDQFSRMADDEDYRHVGTGVAALAAVMAASYAMHFYTVAYRSMDVLRRFSGIYKYFGQYIFTPYSTGIGGGVAGALSARRKGDITDNPDPRAFIFSEGAHAYYRPPFEILSVPYDGLKASYTHTEFIKDLESLGAGVGASLAVSFSAKQAVAFLYRTRAAEINLMLAETMGEGVKEAATKFLNTSFLRLKPGSIPTMVIAFMASMWANQFMADWADRAYVNQFRSEFDGAVAHLVSLKDAGDWTLFLWGAKMTAAEREWSAIEAAPIVQQMNSEIFTFERFAFCSYLNTRPQKSQEIANWPRRELLNVEQPMDVTYQAAASLFQRQINDLFLKHKGILLKSQNGFRVTIEALNKYGVPHSDQLINEMRRGMQITDNLLALNSIAEFEVAQTTANLADLREGGDAWNDLNYLNSLNVQYSCGR